MSFTENAKAVVERLSQIRIVPVLVLEEENSGLKMCEVLLECGLPAAEITFRTAAAAGIKAIIAPAGSLRDADVIKRANELGVALFHAPERIFSHH